MIIEVKLKSLNPIKNPESKVYTLAIGGETFGDALQNCKEWNCLRAEEGKEVHQGRLRVEREEGEVRGLREAEEIQKVQTGGLQVEEEQGEVPRQEVGVGP
jgi:hypothetical protein